MQGWIAWIVANPEAATALATIALVAVGLLIGSGQIAVVWWGIRSMVRSGEARERDHERRHRETMADIAARHEEAGKRHAEAMRASGERHEEALRTSGERHEEAMRALEVLIERTAPAAAE